MEGPEDSGREELSVGKEAVHENTAGDDATTSETKNEGGDSSKGSSRKKHKCPYPSCSAEVVHLPRHMLQQKHNWEQTDARGVLNMFGLRCEKQTKANKRKRVFKQKMCPVYKCKAVVKRIHNHLTDYHKMKRTSKVYKRCLAEAVRYDRKDISSSESTPSESGSSEEDNAVASRGKQRRLEKAKKSKGFFEQVYPSEEESETEEFVPYPEIFHEKKMNISYNPAENDCDEQSESEGSILSKSEIDESCGEENENPDCIDKSGVEDVEEVPVATVSPPSQQDLFNNFEAWLQGPDGGRKEERVARQCSRQIQMVVEYIDKEKRDLKNILQKHILRDKWLTQFEKDKRPGTVKSYLASLNHFYVFLKCENPPQVDASEEMLSCLSSQVKLWNKSFQRLVKDRFWEKRLEDMEQLRTPEQVKEFDVSSVARSAIKILGDYQDMACNAVPSQAEYTSVRDYLLTLLCINNGSRAGSLANMTLGEFQKAKKEEDCFVVMVKRHKTFTTHGPANVTMSSSLHYWINLYVVKFRNTLENPPKEDAAPLFLSTNSRPMRASAVGSQIGSCWGKVFGKDLGAGGATAFRKAAVSAVHRSDAGQREKLAGLMDHHKSTADKYYLLQNKTKSAVQSSKYLSRLMHIHKPSNESEPGNVPSTSNIDAQGSPPKENEGEQARRRWTPEETSAVKSAFLTNIESRAITMSEVRVAIKDHPILGCISPYKVRDKVRALFEEEGTIPLGDLPSETPQQRLTRIGVDGIESKKDENSDNGSESLFTPSVVLSTNPSKKSASKLFTDEENAVFKKTFQRLIETKQSISQKFVREKMEAEPVLKPLLEKYTTVQLADKVRTERRIYGRNSR
ncbi:uncharacterized protein LOC114538102 [Dendronephthya gigantea]|uniref:uncharacterized protein LOC114538102 n=1 Tax=Dendronephthya gigantea TaxID=151771 RepID=UPI00106B3756|nr:uncharacterized protein LOC114538102 [Dendronephthya gigantea]